MGDWHYQIRRTLIQTAITDVHTHLFDPCFGSKTLSGLDELLTYPSLVLEALRYKRLNPAQFQAMSKAAQAETVWQSLFVENTPLSHATRSLLTTLQGLGLNLKERRLDNLRAVFPQNAVDQVLGISGVARLVMSNDPFDEKERAIWQTQPQRDPRFYASLKLDALVFEWGANWQRLKTWGYKVGPDFAQTDEIMRFLDTWVDRTQPLYCSLTLTPDFKLTGEAAQLLRKYVLPLCARRGLALALLQGQRPLVNPQLGPAGDGVGRADLSALEELCREFPEQRFLATLLALENQHELLVLARKFANLLPFGCWGFLSNPSLIEALTRMRLEMLGTTFVPQHSGAYILEQLIGKWVHFKSILVEVLARAYESLEQLGYEVESEQIEQDLRDMLGESFWRFLGKPGIFA